MLNQPLPAPETATLKPRLVQPLGPWTDKKPVVKLKRAPAKPARMALPRWSHAEHGYVYRRLDALRIGDTVEFELKRFRRRPGSIADHFSRRTGKRVRSMATSRGVMFVRVE